MTSNGTRRVVVGVDGSPNSMAALHAAEAEALRRRAELDIILVMPPDARESQLSDGAVTLEEIVGREFPEGLRTTARYLIERGDPAPILLNASADADLLVIGARGRVGDSRIFGVRTAKRCLDHGRCPVKVCGCLSHWLSLALIGGVQR